MRVVKDRAVSCRELLFTGRFEALIDARPLVLAGGLSSNAGDAVAAASRATDLPIRPTLLLKELKAIIVGFVLAGYVYQVHKLSQL